MSNAINELQNFIQQRQQSAGVSVVVPTEIPLVDTAMPLSDYQVEGAKFALAKRRVLIADEMGVGKTPQAIGIVLSAVTAGHSPMLVVVPPSMRLQWVREFAKFAPTLKVHVITTKDSEVVGGEWREKIVTTGKGANMKHKRVKYIHGGTVVPYPVADVYLAGDLSIAGHATQLKSVVKGIIVDECHRMKSIKRAQRTRAVVDIAKALPADAVRVVMSGTPLINHPLDLMPSLLVLDRMDDFANNGMSGFEYFMGRFAPKIDRWGARGVAHTDELHDTLKAKFMIRRKRSEVLTLPNKGRISHHVEIAPAIADKYMEAEADLFAFIEDAKGTPSAERAMKAEAISRINTLRELAGHGKVAGVVAYVKALLDENEQVFITTTHRAVAEAYVNHLSKVKMPDGKFCNVVRIEGGMSDTAKMASVDAFQAGTANVLVGNVIASGVGITLTAGRHHVNAEMCWTSADLMQCEDRLARRGQEREVVSHIMLGCIEGDLTIDERLFNIVDAKCGILAQVLDGASHELINEEEQSNAIAVLATYGWGVGKR
jgi:SWI/SNF-related matrix-associated actin-dependent regulator of chromatin subfamily A-like protein 1